MSLAGGHFGPEGETGFLQKVDGQAVCELGLTEQRGIRRCSGSSVCLDPKPSAVGPE